MERRACVQMFLAAFAPVPQASPSRPASTSSSGSSVVWNGPLHMNDLQTSSACIPPGSALAWRPPQPTMAFGSSYGKPELSTLPGIETFYFALTNAFSAIVNRRRMCYSYIAFETPLRRLDQLAWHSEMVLTPFATPRFPSIRSG